MTQTSSVGRLGDRSIILHEVSKYSVTETSLFHHIPEYCTLVLQNPEVPSRQLRLHTRVGEGPHCVGGGGRGGLKPYYVNSRNHGLCDSFSPKQFPWAHPGI